MSMKNYKHTEETKKKMSNSHKGKITWNKGLTNVQNYNSIKGKRNWNWKGGITTGKENSKIYQRNKKKEYRNATIEVMGGKCVRCGFDDKRALQFDHIKGGGTRELKNIGYSNGISRHVLKSFLSGEKKFQLLCANCNWIKRDENNEIRPRS